MADTTIEWTDKVWNPVTGCTKVSPGCKFCYAERIFKRPYPDREFTDVHCHPERLDQPLRWKKPRRIFVNSMSDLFHETVPDGFIMRCLYAMAHTPQHTYQILTKRPQRMKEFFTRWADLKGEDFEPKLVRGPEATREAHPSGRGQLFADMLESMGTPPEGCAYPTFDWLEGMISWPTKFWNIHLGVSCEDQETADERIPLLLQTPAAVRFVSAEPLLGPLQFPLFCIGSKFWSEIHWVIVGGESGPNGRPCDLGWIRPIVSQCALAGVPCFVKQLGRAPYEKGPSRPGDPFVFPGWTRVEHDGIVEHYRYLRPADHKGGDPAEWPVDLRVREFPSG